MIEVLHFIFSGFWTFAGCVVLIVAMSAGMADIIRAIRGH